ncbi:hypothetical protein G5B40_00520 [Pikeienuella piscinae]|uniref:FecR protein domain-containing protein n=1 Tax=Pikeienuella piscinae TaxID=2748098 RepID=A0A7L5BVZ7_9RHOB|nr:FecR domain-containing protein [Pikeienuella piscinae]QIE54054.1 hypothetical protein G5B40_00520 [Pikeienuella piscinae]
MNLFGAHSPLRTFRVISGSASLVSLFLLSAPFADAQEIGVMGAANPDLTGTAPSAQPRPLLTGDAVFSDDDIVSGPDGLGFAMFLDQTSLTIAPNSRIRLDKYVYDPGTQTGDVQVSLLRGAVRMIGGRITKTNEATIRTATATIGIRGGAATVESMDGGAERVTLLGGEYARVSAGADEVYISRPGGYARVGAGGDVAYGGLLDSATAAEIAGLFITPGGGGAPPARTAASAGRLAEVNSLTPDGISRAAASTTGLFLDSARALDDDFNVTTVNEIAQGTMFSDMDTLNDLADNMDFVDVGGAGVVRGQLTWADDSDLDLHLILPNDAGEVFFANRSITFNDGRAVATLDADNLGGVINVAPNKRVENIVVNGESVPRGTYVFFVDAFSIRGNGATDYTLNATGDNGRTTRTQRGTLRSGGQGPNFPIPRGPAD